MIGRRALIRHKHAAVLCPGPSLGDFVSDAARPYDIRIAVNRAALLILADYWICLDRHTAEWGKPIGKPIIVCTKTSIDAMARRLPWIRELKHRQILATSCGVERRPVKWHQWGWSMAAVLGYELGCAVVDCYGMDWSGEEDFDGFTDGRQQRTPERWAAEAERFDLFAEVLAKQGTLLRRICAATVGGVA